MRAWVVRTGRQGEREGAALQQGLVVVGWPGTPDLSASTGRADIRRAMDTAYPDENGYTRRSWSGQLYRFRHEMAVGDIVLLPRNDGQFALGSVVGEYAYRPDAEEGMRHVRGVEWKITNLARDVFHPDLLQSLGSLLTVFELRRYNAADRVAVVAQGGSDPGRPNDGGPGASLAARRQLIERVHNEERDQSQPVQLTVRKLLELWGAERRDPATATRIQRDLEEAGLLSIPPFTEGTLDSVVAMVAAGAEPGAEGANLLTRLSRFEMAGPGSNGRPSAGEGAMDALDMSGAAQRVLGSVRSELPEQRASGSDLVSSAGEEISPSTDNETDAGYPSVAYLVGNLPSANLRPEFVTTADTLASARTQMMLREFSQLPVLDDQGRLKGAISWTSIGSALMFNPQAELADAIGPAQEVPATHHLLDCIGLIEKHGFVLVRDDAHRVCGIVTPADIAVEFRSRVSPFVLIEEVEQRLRRIVDQRLGVEYVRACLAKTNKKKAAEAEDASALSLGNYPHLFRDDAAWKHAQLPLDQGHFTSALKRCAELRNDLMHFSPDPVGKGDIDFLNGLLSLLRNLDGQG